MERRIGLRRRLGALVLDLVFLIGLYVVILLVLEGLLSGFAGWGQHRFFAAVAAVRLGAGQGLPLMSLVFTVLLPLYFLLSEGLRGGSPGKKLAGIRVGTEDGRPGIRRMYLRRYLVKYSGLLAVLLGFLVAMAGLPAAGDVLMVLGAALVLVVLAGCLLALGRRRQALHDLVVMTAVFPDDLLAYR